MGECWAGRRIQGEKGLGRLSGELVLLGDMRDFLQQTGQPGKVPKTRSQETLGETGVLAHLSVISFTLLYRILM